MAEQAKDPERVRLGRLGALTVHAGGKTNTVPARKAWEAALAAEHGISDDLDPAERDRRVRSALRARMTRLAMARWKKKAGPDRYSGPAQEIRRAYSDEPPDRAA